MITIYNFPRGARGVRLFWQCEEMGLPYRRETVTFPPSEAYRAINPMGSVPAMQDGDVTMNESVAIMLYLAQTYGPTPLLPPVGNPAFAEVVRLLVFSEATLGASLNTLMAAHFAAPEDQKGNWSVQRSNDTATKALQLIENTLAGREYLVGNAFTLADIAYATALGMWQGALGREVPPKLTAWRDRQVARPAYQRASQ